MVLTWLIAHARTQPLPVTPNLVCLTPAYMPNSLHRKTMLILDNLTIITAPTLVAMIVVLYKFTSTLTNLSYVHISTKI